MGRRRNSRGRVRSPGAVRPVAPVLAMRGHGWRRQLALAIALCSVVIVGYLPAVHGDFIWDDRVLLTQNPMVWASDGLYDFWFTTKAHDYWPLTSTTFWLEWRVWGLEPTGYHVTNIALHVAEALLLWMILLRLNIGGAYLASLLFAVHPVNVESVAWIAQRKNLVGMLFLLLATLFFLKANTSSGAGTRPGIRGPGHRWYWLSLASFVLALLGKGSVAILPLLLLLLVWWENGDVTVRDLLRLLPFLLTGGLFVLVNIWFQTHGEGQIRDAGLVERLLGAGAAVWFYLSKAMLPVDLSFVYPQWQIDAVNPLWWIPLSAALVVSVALLQHRRGWGRPYVMAWAFFCVALLPAMGLADVYFMRYSLVADHYQHIALIGVVVLAAAMWSEWERCADGLARVVAVGVAFAVVGVLTILTARQSGAYQDENTLYRAAIEANPDAWLAHYNLAVNLRDEGRREEEITHLLEAVRARPDYGDAHSNLAAAFLEEGQVDRALAHAMKAVESDPTLPHAQVNLGIALSRAGRPEEALEPLEKGVRMLPHSAEAHHNLGLALAAVGRLGPAIDEHREALRIEPESPENHKALAEATAASGRFDEAIRAFGRALALRPDDPEALVKLGFVLVLSGQPREATLRYEEALRLQPLGPHAPEAHYNLGVVLMAEGRKDEALDHYARALQLRPNYAEAHYNVALEHLRDGRGGDAVEHLEEAVRGKPDLLPARLVLAEVYARTGLLEKAVEQARAAMPMASAGTRKELEGKIRLWQATPQ